MFKEKNYNDTLRSRVLICSIRTEEAATDVIRNLLRLVKPKSKTLGNKSSSLSFKNKIDLLYDIDDLTTDEYNAQLKFMEIRNQFIHNPDCNSFIELSSQFPDYTNYLKKSYPNTLSDQESSYEESFKQLFLAALGKLLILKVEYRKGFSTEVERFIDATAFKNIESAYEAALEKWQSSISQSSSLPTYEEYGGKSPADFIKEFKGYFMYTIIGEQIKVCDDIEKNITTEQDVFQRREKLIKTLKEKEV